MWSFDDWWEGYLAWLKRGVPPMDKSWAKVNVRSGAARNPGVFSAAHSEYWTSCDKVPTTPGLTAEAVAELEYPEAFDKVFAVVGYDKLALVLTDAYAQAAKGKGKERHANDLPFHLQPMQQIAQRRGIGFILGQADKKSEEAQGMLEHGERDKAVHELLGAIVYLAGAVIHIRKQEQ